MSVPVTGWDETSPVGSQAISLGDDRIREMKTQIRQVIAVDHIMSASGNGATWGFHNKVTLYSQAADPDAVADSLVLFTKDVAGKSELHFIDEDSNTMQLTSGGKFIGGMEGEVRMWKGLLSAIPAGWEIDTGLVGKFVRGINTGATNPGTTGGADTKTLAETNLPSHRHTITHDHGSHTHNASHGHTTWNTNSGTGSHYHSFAIGGNNPVGYVYNIQGGTTSPYYIGYVFFINEAFNLGSRNTNTDGSHQHSFYIPTTSVETDGAYLSTNISSGYVGSATAFDIRPAYYELAFIVRS